MKKIFTYSLAIVAIITLLAGCRKRDHYDDRNDQEEESGIVTYISQVNSPYSVIEMDYDGQFAVVYSTDESTDLWPERNDIIIGDFTPGNSRVVYNKTLGKNIRLEVDEFFTYEDDAVNSVKRKEDSEGYTSAYKKNPVKVQRRPEADKPAVK